MTRRSMRSIAAHMLLLSLSTGCDTGPPVPASVSLSPASLRFNSLADTALLTATVRDEGGEVIPNPVITWSSSDATIAQVGPPEQQTSAGLVTSVANGSATITATAGAVSAAATVQIEQVATSLHVSAPQDSLIVGDSIQMTAQASDAVGSAVVDALFSWESSDPAIATVDDDGWVRAHAPGSAEITATFDELSASASLVSIPLPERRVLQAIYEAGGGALWKDNTNWLTDAPLEEWHGVRVDEDGQVVHLLLTDNGLIGEIPPEIASLEHLESLHLGLNNLAGPIPPEIGHLRQLRSLELTYNAHSGPLPPEIGNLANLEWLGAFGNDLTGEIPPEIGNLAQLESLDLCYNKLTGPIPPEIGNLRQLRRLALCGIDTNPTEGNQLTGEIPPEIGNLVQLSLLSLGANRLTGPIPPEIGNLAQLDSLLLYSNELTAIPPEVGNLESLAWLTLYGNRLTGPLPPEIGNLHKLRVLNIGWGWASGRNLITGPIPPEIGNLAALERLDLGGNQLSGPIPATIGNLGALTNLELGSNTLSGVIPVEVGDLTRLTSLAVCKNNLDGPIPVELGNLTRLSQLFLCTNALSGPVPEDLGNLSLLRRLNVAGNRLTSALPATLVSLGRLQEFFWLKNDGLCAPTDDDFDAWLSGIAVQGGERCVEAASGIATIAPAISLDDTEGPWRHVTEVRPLSPRPIPEPLRRQ